MTHLIIHYLHRDEGNWKDHLHACVHNPAGYPASEAEEMIRNCLINKEYFYAEKVRFPRSEFAADTDWHELESVADCECTDEPLAMSLETFLQKLRESNANFLKPRPVTIHKVLAGIPIRLAVSWLEFLRETRQSLEMIVKLAHKKSVVVIFRNEEDWSLIEETLRIDARSGNFDSDLRKDIERALDGMKEVPDFPSLIKTLRWKTGKLQKQINRVVQQ